MLICENCATRLGELQNTHESVAALAEWEKSAQQGHICYFSWADQESVTSKGYRAPHYRVDMNLSLAAGLGNVLRDCLRGIGPRRTGGDRICSLNI